MYLFVCLLLDVGCGYRHVLDAFVSLHAFFPVVPTKGLYCDSADSPWIQTVWSDACRNKTKKKHSSHIITCGRFHWKPVWIGTVVQNTMIIYSIINKRHYRVNQSKHNNQCGRWCNMFTAHVTVMCFRESYRIHQGWNEVCRNFEPHTSYRMCVLQREC